MAIQTPPEQVLAKNVVATGGSFEEYLERYAADFCEWVGGKVIKMSSSHEYHDILNRYLTILLEAYFEMRPIGRTRRGPFVMKQPAPLSVREPDIQVILNSNPHELTPTYMDGPADICIEVVSPESVSRDHCEKFEEYEKSGVREYWIVDRLHKECRFYRRDEAGQFVPFKEDAQGNYQTPLLPGLVVQVATLWGADLPGPGAIVQAVQTMLKDVR